MDKPKTTIKKPALYKMVSFKGGDKSASKETKDMNEGLKVNLSAVNSLGATVNSPVSYTHLTLPTIYSV